MTASIETPSIVHLHRHRRAGRVIALHWSALGASQWCSLEQKLGGRYEVIAPEHYGCDSTGPWSGEHAFRLADEAERAVAAIDRGTGKVHLVGHSYGGAVALSTAVARPTRVASLTLYEPSAFHLLRAMGDEGGTALAEVAAVARGIGDSVLAGDYIGAAAAFLDYWCGAGAWGKLQPWVQSAFIRWVAKAPMEFHALMEEPTPFVAYTGLSVPILILRGEHAPRPTRMIAELLSSCLPDARTAVVKGAGHTGPLTHAPAVNALIASHIVGATDAATINARFASVPPSPPPVARAP
jgi:pimeloyl-ACP methyl ester carboxylesterase